jgi:hypothetical protein
MEGKIGTVVGKSSSFYKSPAKHPAFAQDRIADKTLPTT